jgi:beta-lactam-binding protein with PASTA domain
VAVAYQHVREPAAPPSDHDTEVAPEVDAIVMKSLAKRVEDRYQSAAAMRSDIERYLAGHPVHVVAPPPPLEPPTTITPPTTVVTPVPPPVEEEPDEDRGTRPGLLIFLALLLLLVLGLAAYLLPKMFASPNDQVSVPDLSGMTEQNARAALGDAGLEVGNIDRAFDNTVKANHVVSQDPGADESVAQGATVDFTVSLGTHPTRVPYVIGQTRQQAQTALQDAHLDPVFHPTKSDQPKGTVVRTDPPANTQVPQGSPVDVFVSKGPQKIPDVVGMQQADAEKALRDAGFVPVPVPSSSSDAPQGQVIQQIPGAGQTAQQGAQVTIVVSSGPSSPTTSPTSPSTGTSSPPTSPSTSTGPSAKPPF